MYFKFNIALEVQKELSSEHKTKRKISEIKSNRVDHRSRKNSFNQFIKKGFIFGNI